MSFEEIFLYRQLVQFMVFNVTFSNISAISRRSIFLIEEITQRKQPTCRISLTNLSHNVVSNTHRHQRDSNSILVVIDTDCTDSCKSNYQMITTMAAPAIYLVELRLFFLFQYLRRPTILKNCHSRLTSVHTMRKYLHISQKIVLYCKEKFHLSNIAKNVQECIEFCWSAVHYCYLFGCLCNEWTGIYGIRYKFSLPQI